MKRFLQVCVIRFLTFFARHGFPLLVRTCALMIPPACWYGIALRCSRTQARIVRLFRHDPSDHTAAARIMDRWFAAFTSTGRPYPIPMHIEGVDEFLRATDHRTGTIVCSAHLPLYRILAKTMVDLGRPPQMLIAGDPEWEGKLAIWGLSQGLPAARPSMDVLVKVRTILRNGGFVGLLLDPFAGAPYSQSVFRLARRTNSRLLFCFVELRPDGVIQIEWVAPPDPFCHDQSGILQNLEFLDSRVREIWYGKVSSPGSPVQAQPAVQSANKREIISLQTTSTHPVKEEIAS